MKTTFLIVALVVTLARASAWAEDQAKDAKQTKAASTQKQNKKKVQPPVKEEDVFLTGSHLKQKIRRTDRITDGANNVVVIDRAQIDRSGAADLRHLLGREGFH